MKLESIVEKGSSILLFENIHHNSYYNNPAHIIYKYIYFLIDIYFKQFKIEFCVTEGAFLIL